MLKTKDGYAKVIGTSYQGSSDYLLLSNGDSKAISSLSVNYANSAGNADTLDGAHLNGLLTSVSNVNNGISVTVGGTTKSVSNISVNQAVISDVANLLDSHDERINQYYPYEVPRGIRLRFQNENNNGLNSGGYYGLLSWRSYGVGNDLSGGYPFQIAYLQSGDLCTRVGTGAQSWSPWRKLACLDSNVASADKASALKYTGTGHSEITAYQTSSSYMGRSGWASYIICNHGDGSTYYSQTIAMPFDNSPIYRRLENGVDKGWKKFYTEEEPPSWQSISDKITGGNEFNIVNTGFNNWLWFNYLPINNRNSSAAISQYNMGNGNKGLASVYAYRFKAEGKGCMWKNARNYAPFYATFNGGFEPILDIKTVGGDWSIGSYDAYGNHLIFAFTSDSDYNAGVNGTAQYYLTAGGEFKINTLRLAGAVTGNMGVGSTNPQIIFAEGSTTQQVAITYTDQDAYRVSKGLKVHSHDGSDDANVWFEVQGYNYSSGYVKNGSSDAYVLLGGGGHKPLSEFSTNTANVADTIKIWEHESNDAWYYVTWTTQNGTGYGSIYESTASLQYNPSQKTLWTNGGLWASDYVRAASIRLEYTNEVNSYSGDLYLNNRKTAAGSLGNTANIRMCGNGGNVIIGANDTPYYQLDVRGSVIASAWLRTRGQCGWYSETYGGGIYMTDTSWIRTYGSKPFYCDRQIYSSDSIRAGNIYLQNTNEINNDTNGALHLNYRNTGNITLCNGGGAVTIGTTSTDIGNNKLYVNGSEFINGASNVKDHVFANGFRHRSHNSNDSVLLAGGGYSQGVPVKYWSIETIIIYGPTQVSRTNRGGNYTFVTKVEPRINGSCTLTLQFPSGYNNYNTIIWAMGRLNQEAHDSSNSSIYATIVHLEGSKYYLNLADDESLNNGTCQLYFMCF